MARVSLRNVLGRVWALLLTALSVVLGTGFVAGAFVFTDSIDATFTELFESTATGTDVVVRGVEGAAGGPTGASAVPMPIELGEEIAAVDGVDRVVPSIDGSAILVGEDGTAARNGGAPTLGFAYEPDDPTLELVEGRAPRDAGEVVVETSTLELAGLAVGDTTRVVAGPEVRDVTVVGRVDFDAGLAGATIVLLDYDSAVGLYTPDGLVSGFNVTGEDGTEPGELAARVGGVLPETAEAVTAESVVEEGLAALEEGLGFVNVFLLVVGAVALLVGAFIIANVFSMLLARRSRELALLRAVGASRRQVLASVVTEAVVVGLVGSLAGLAVGVGIAAGLQVVVGLLGLDVSGGLPVSLTTVLTTVVVGVVVTVVSAAVPALRASRIPPVAAMRDDVALPERQVRLRAVLGLALAALGAVGMGVGLFGDVDGSLQVLGGGVLAVFLGVAVAAPAIARPVVWLVLAPSVLVAGAVGRLARQNALRNPRRTAATASALMIGTALVGAAWILTDSINASISDTIDDELTADFVLSGGGQALISPAVAEAAEEIPGVAAVVPLRAVGMLLDPAEGGGAGSGGSGEADEAAADAGEAGQGQGTVLFAGAGDPSAVLETVDVRVVDGRFETLADDEVVLTEDVAEAEDLAVGDSLTAAVGVSPARELTVVGLLEATQVLGVEAIVAPQLYDDGVPAAERGDFLVYVAAGEDADLAAVRDALTDEVSPFLVVSVLDREEFTSEQTAQVTQILGFVVALLLLSVVVAAVGIVITLVLSVIERQREVGLLRAVGLTRAQLRQVVTLEGVATSVFGALLGIGLGVAFGLALQSALADQGIEVLSVPTVGLALTVVAAIVLGVVAAAAPAWWAARQDVLRAIATE